jgi:FHS family L-fucose permease-like MFS transporter
MLTPQKFVYVGAQASTMSFHEHLNLSDSLQVTIGSFFINNAAEAGIADSEASQLLSYGLITFTVCRFVSATNNSDSRSNRLTLVQVGTALLSVLSAPVLLFLCACGAAASGILIGSLPGMGSVIFAIVIMGFESIMYPVIFVLGTTGLGRHTRRGAALLVMGVSGGAIFPPM